MGQQTQIEMIKEQALKEVYKKLREAKIKDPLLDDDSFVVGFKCAVEMLYRVRVPKKP